MIMSLEVAAEVVYKLEGSGYPFCVGSYLEALTLYRTAEKN